MAIVLLIVIPTIGSLVVSPDTSSGLWCQKVEMPGYEKTLGFRLGTFTVPRKEGGTYDVMGFAWIDSGSPWADAGLREGDVPMMRQGLGGVCDALAEAARGEPATLRVANVEDARRGDVVWRDLVHFRARD